MIGQSGSDELIRKGLPVPAVHVAPDDPALALVRGVSISTRGALETVEGYSGRPVTVDVADVETRLSRLDVPPRLVEAAVSVIPVTGVGLLVYGSRARDDFTNNSDLDLLALVHEPLGSRTYRDVNLSCYTREQFVSASGTLFGMHIRRDGVVIADPTGEFVEMIQELEQPDASRLLARVRHFSAILESRETSLDLHLPGMCRLARYLLRTAIYSLALAEGRPCFSVRELAARFDEPGLVTLLSSDPRIVSEPSRGELETLRGRLRMAVGKPPPTGHRSLESLAVAEWDDDRERSTLAIMAMTGQDEELDYSELPKVLL